MMYRLLGTPNNVLVPHKELFMAFCFGPLYILLGLSYLLEA